LSTNNQARENGRQESRTSRPSTAIPPPPISERQARPRLCRLLQRPHLRQTTSTPPTSFGFPNKRDFNSRRRSQTPRWQDCRYTDSKKRDSGPRYTSESIYTRGRETERWMASNGLLSRRWLGTRQYRDREHGLYKSVQEGDLRCD